MLPPRQQNVPRLSDAYTAARTDGRAAPRPVSMRVLGLVLTLLLATLGTVGYLAYDATCEETPQEISRRQAAAGQAKGGPAIDVPPVEPVEFLPVAQDAARKINGAVPFSKAPNPPAMPMRLMLPVADLSRAIDCLAAAAWYEAGDDAIGEHAVVQVVLNRMRHPAFPKSVCAVVFQGSERRTGCQFSFTCDGAMARIPSPAAWQRAQGIAIGALRGAVFAPVGYATHYHTDWVVPNWSAGVDKITAVGTHLFFRWRGAAGRPLAFRGGHVGSEPIVAKMVTLSPAHAGKVDVSAADIDALAQAAIAQTAADQTVPVVDAPPPPAVTTALRGNALAGNDSQNGLFVVQIAADQQAGALALSALDLCRSRSDKPCTVVGFRGAPGRVVANGARVRWGEKAPDFYYFSDRSRGRELLYWNCTVFPRPAKQCLPNGFVPNG